MIKSTVGHMQLMINPANMAFYKDLLSFLGWAVWYEDENMLGMGNEQGSSLWFGAPLKEVKNDYDGIGLNHLGIAVPQQVNVDETVAYLQEHGVKALFDTPRHRPEFCRSSDQTYYQVMFESPDRLLFEIVYTGPLVK
ncbi:MAG: hypothetical protein LWX83_09445 [Anaerolineae bacterium]|nr:hypothetical protein [Anaerolineae bacterium]